MENLYVDIGASKVIKRKTVQQNIYHHRPQKYITLNKAKKTLSNVTGSAKKRIEFMESYNY